MPDYEAWTLQISRCIRVEHVLDTDIPRTLSDTCRTLHLVCLFFIICLYHQTLWEHFTDTRVLPPDIRVCGHVHFRMSF